MKKQRSALVYGYGRHSTHKQDLTQDVQKQRCYEYFQRSLLGDGCIWQGFYYDTAVSAGRTSFAERPQGKMVFHSLQPGDHLVLSRLDRCFRSVLDGVNVMEMLEKRGVYFHSLDLSIDTRTPLGRYVRNILLAGAELERDLARERANETIAYLQSQDLPYTRVAPIGWKIVRRNKRREYRVDQEERDFVELLREGRDAGASVYDLANYCWNTQERFGTSRNFGNLSAIKWALQAHALGFPKVVGRRRINKLWREQHDAGLLPQF